MGSNARREPVDPPLRVSLRPYEAMPPEYTQTPTDRSDVSTLGLRQRRHVLFASDETNQDLSPYSPRQDVQHKVKRQSSSIPSSGDSSWASHLADLDLGWELRLLACSPIVHGAASALIIAGCSFKRFICHLP